MPKVKTLASQDSYFSVTPWQPKRKAEVLTDASDVLVVPPPRRTAPAASLHVLPTIPAAPSAPSPAAWQRKRQACLAAARSMQPENAVPAPQSPAGAEVSTLESDSPDTEPEPVAASQASGLGYVAVTPDGMCVGETTPSA